MPSIVFLHMVTFWTHACPPMSHTITCCRHCTRWRGADMSPTLDSAIQRREPSRKPELSFVAQSIVVCVKQLQQPIARGGGGGGGGARARAKPDMGSARCQSPQHSLPERGRRGEASGTKVNGPSPTCQCHEARDQCRLLRPSSPTTDDIQAQPCMFSKGHFLSNHLPSRSYTADHAMFAPAQPRRRLAGGPSTWSSHQTSLFIAR